MTTTDRDATQHIIADLVSNHDDASPIFSKQSSHYPCQACQRQPGEIMYFSESGCGAYQVCGSCARAIWRGARDQGRELRWQTADEQEEIARQQRGAMETQWTRLDIERQRATKVRLLLWQALIDATDFPPAGYAPETLAVCADTTGYQGGDAGHGGRAHVRFGFQPGSVHGAHAVHIVLRTGERLNFDDGEIGSLEISASGDWEQEGLYVTLARAARALAWKLENGSQVSAGPDRG